ncbi:MAG: NACHT domain-containing protein [Anaerolineales bacterium]|nr:NACHT domain-containing protein [Anaerolineales bacterium]
MLARPEIPDGETWERRVAGRGFDKNAIPEEAMQEMGRGMSAAPMQIEEALREKTRVVVLGDPGSGKSTMLKYLALRLAKDKDAPLPILLPLNAYAKALQQKEINLQAYLSEYFAARAESVASLAPLFKEAIEHGKAVILLDGLDEVQSNRAALVQKVEAFSHDVIARGNRVLVTSRIVGYRDASLSAQNWSLYTLLDFTPEAIRTFANQWCLAFEKSTLGDTPEAEKAAKAETESLLEALRTNPGVERLASNPLLLTILALIKRQGVELPKSRIKLYDRYLETLIDAWNRASALDKSAGRESMDYEATLEVLGPLALRIREENPTAGLVSARQLQEWLAEYYMKEWGLKRDPPARKRVSSSRTYVHTPTCWSNAAMGSMASFT